MDLTQSRAGQRSLSRTRGAVAGVTSFPRPKFRAQVTRGVVACDLPVMSIDGRWVNQHTDQLSFQPLRRRAGRDSRCTKKRYRTESDALEASKHLRRYGYTSQRAYQCTERNCAAWHLSSKPEFESRSLAGFLARSDWA